MNGTKTGLSQSALKHSQIEREVKKLAKCDAPLNPNAPKCCNQVHTEVFLQCKETSKLEHFLWLCREHSGTNDEIVVLQGEFFDGTHE